MQVMSRLRSYASRRMLPIRYCQCWTALPKGESSAYRRLSIFPFIPHPKQVRVTCKTHALITIRSDGRTRAGADHYANPPNPRFIVFTIDAKDGAQTLLDAVMHSLALLCAVINAFWLPGARAGLERLAKGGNVRFVGCFDSA